MEIRKLEAFTKVVELQSFTKAAAAIFLTQPTVSQHIRDLESELQQKLLDRFGHETLPTAAGKLLYNYAKKILQTQQEAIDAVTQFGIQLAGRIRVGCGTIPGTYILPPLIGEFRKKHPAIKTTLKINSSRLIADQVIAGDLELGVIGARWQESALEWVELFSDELVLALPPHHPWAKAESISLQQIIKEPFILREQGSGTRKTLAQFFTAAGLKESNLAEVAEIGSTAATKEAIKGNVGISIMSQLAISADIHSGTLATATLNSGSIKRSFYLIWRKNRELTPVSRTFKEYLFSSLLV